MNLGLSLNNSQLPSHLELLILSQGFNTELKFIVKV